MTTNHHTPIPAAPAQPEATSELFNSRFSELDAGISGKLDPAGDGSNLKNTFSQAAERTNIVSGEKISTSLGKIRKWFADLKQVAFTGSYNDLSDKPDVSTPAPHASTHSANGTDSITITKAQISDFPTDIPATNHSHNGTDSQKIDYENLLNAPEAIDAYCWVRYSDYENPTDAQIKTTPADYMGISTGSSPVAPTTASSYIWSKIKGDQGQQGNGLIIKGYYSDLTALTASVPTPTVGDVFGVGAVAPYEIYIWDAANQVWINNGSIQGPQGDAATVEVGTVTTGAPGSSAAVTNSGTSAAAVLDFTIPQGQPGVKGDAATIDVGTVTTGAPGSSAAVNNSGTSAAAVFDFTIPQGQPGVKGDAATIAVGTVTTGTPGSSAAVTNSGTSAAAVFDFTIPQGQQGPQGIAGPLGLSVTEVTLAASAWSNKNQTVAVSGVTASSVIIVSPKTVHFMAYTDARCYASAVGAGTVIFSCDTVPTVNLTVYVMRYMG